MATQNPIEMEGTYPLPEAQLDRFMMKVLVDSPDSDELVEILERTTGAAEIDIEPVTDAATLRQMIALTREVPVAAHLNRFAAELVAATHPTRPDSPDLVRRYARFGASPRGAQALILTAKARALLEGRLNVAEEDIRSVVRPALRHRIILTYEALADGVTTDDVLEAVLQEVPEPARELEGLG
jgi:MoxR-like ATPase